MYPDRMTRLCSRMATVSLWLMTLLLLINIGGWFSPFLLSLTPGWVARWMLDNQLNPAMMPWWQSTGGAALSCLPFFVLGGALWQLRRLFLLYAAGELFSPAAARILGLVGRLVFAWGLLGIAMQPLMSVWLTMLAAPGHRLVTISASMSDIVVLYMAGCISVIAHVLGKANQLEEENRLFL